MSCKTQKIYVGQDAKLVFELDPDGTAGITQSDISSAIIKAKKPDGSTVEWTGSIDGTTVVYHASESDIDQSGVWLMQPWVTFVSGGKAPGQTVKEYIYGDFG